MTAEVIYLEKSVRQDDAVILHWQLTSRYASQLRVGVNLAIASKTAADRLVQATQRSVFGTGQEWANFYGWDLDPRQNAGLQALITERSSDLYYIIHRGDGIAAGESMRLMGDWTRTDQRKMLRQIEGLDPRSAKALVNYRNTLLNAKRPQSRGDIEDSVNRYRNELLRRRGNLIATTETATTLNEAHQAVIEQAGREGLVDLEASTKTWLTRSGACPTCAPLGGRSVPYKAPWPTANGVKYFPPVHPNCRCTFILNPRKPRFGG